MRSQNTSSRPVASPFANRIEEDAPADQIAAAFGAVWQELDAILSPIIGPRGVAALGQRSLHLASDTCPWLAAAKLGGLAQLDPSEFVRLLSQRNSGEAAAASNVFLHNFNETLSRLIGPSLCERLLLSVWAPAQATPSKNPPKQEPMT